MSEVIQVLQLGTEDWNQRYQVPKDVEIVFAEVFEKAPKSPYDMVFIEREVSDEEVKELQKATKAYTLFVVLGTSMTRAMEDLYLCKKGKPLQAANIEAFLRTEARNYYSKPYGEKFKPFNMSVAQGFTGKVRWNGSYSVDVEGEFGETFHQIAYWRNNIPIFQGEAIDFWLEYEKDSSVEIALEITQFRAGTISDVQQKWRFTEKELDEIIVVDNQLPTGPVFVSLVAKGNGRLKIIALHDRHSRRGHGLFLPGGQRYVTSKREEIFYYFDPGDMKPPLNVYFSGYKTLQGFEGYYMMRSMGCPFLLIAEPRLEGGSFYMGSDEYEKGFAEIIRKCTDEDFNLPRVRD